ncbi:MAG: peptide chain release factor N(5)-glutamine methyltransferase [Bdellovibrio sp.]|nr:peptide chain release factor N(5)-glutamine methyltransferase [Bdellovibrio sp.]
METLKAHLNQYYKRQQHKLQKWYPGITLQRLQSELAQYLNSDLQCTAFFPGADPRVQFFFDGLEKGIPLEYIIEEAFFYNFPLRVDRRVLIPRKETELLVESVLARLHDLAKQGTDGLNVVDIGTGSGAIALALAINYLGTVPLTITAVDISSTALSLAKQNADRLRYALSPHCRLKWHCGDCLQWDFLSDRKFDLIVSNPPYIMESERESVHPQVVKYEPALALFLKDEEYEKWYQGFFAHIKKQLAISGEAWIEGSENHLKSVASIASKLGFRIEIKRDYTERERFLVLRGNCG